MKTEKKYDFGTIEYYINTEEGIQDCPFSITISLEHWNAPNTFSAWCELCRPDGSNLCSGQCLDEFKQYFYKNKLFHEIYDLWENFQYKRVAGETLNRVKELLKGGKKVKYPNEKKVCSEEWIELIKGKYPYSLVLWIHPSGKKDFVLGKNFDKTKPVEKQCEPMRYFSDLHEAMYVWTTKGFEFI